MTPIADTEYWRIGKYTVQSRPRPDNPAFSLFVVFHGLRLVGKSFSRPDLGCCRWLELGRYAERSHEPLTYRERQEKRRPGRGHADMPKDRCA
ncbi:MAG: hypothetical protein Q8P46_03790 [Hyphomicrobiales bacterium]|nr:hypothetical protein [Hyphomicrobiales bacterium]